MRLVDAWPRELKADRKNFEKLKEAYVKARYSKHYRITEEELRWLGARVEELGRAVHARSEEHTSELQSLMRISYAVFCLKKKKNSNIKSVYNKEQKTEY